MLKWEQIDPNAKGNSTLQANNKKEYCNLENLKSEIKVPNMATVGELNQTILDIEQEVFTDNPTNYFWGLISNNVSNAEGVFEEPPILQINFSENVDSLGLTLTFYDNYCKEINIKWYNNEELLSDKNFQPDDFKYFCDNPINDYNKLIITFIKNIPYRYVKLKQIDYGKIREITDEEIISAKLSESVFPISDSIWINTLNCKVLSLNESFDIITNPKDYEMIKTNQRIKSEEYGSFYIDQYEAKGNIIDLKMVDLLGIIGDREFGGGMYNTTFEAIINEISNECNISQIFEGKHNGFEIDYITKTKIIKGYIPITTIKEVLQEMCFVSNAVLDTSRSDKIKIYQRPIEDAEDILDTEIVLNSDKTGQNSKEFTKVELVAYDYVLSATKEQILSQVYEPGRYRYIYSDIYGDITLENATINKINSNYVDFTVDTRTTVIIEGYKYIENTKTFTQSKSLQTGEIEKIKTINNKKLVNIENGQEICDTIFRYYTLKYKTEFKMLNGKSIGKVYKANNVVGNLEQQEIDLITTLVTKAVLTGDNG